MKIVGGGVEVSSWLVLLFSWFVIFFSYRCLSFHKGSFLLVATGTGSRGFRYDGE
jgi:hypothetical protein